MEYRTMEGSKTATGINKMSEPIGGVFVGLLELADTNTWGITIEKRNYCASHIMVKQCKKPLSIDTAKEEKLIKDGFLYVVYLVGLGSISYLKRFESKQNALNWLVKTIPIDKDQDGSLLLTKV